MNRSTLVLLVGALGLTLVSAGCSSCAYLSGAYACNADENCPFGRACVDGTCVAAPAPVDAGELAGEGEGEGEGGCAGEYVRSGDQEIESSSQLEDLLPPGDECLVIDGDLELSEVSDLSSLRVLSRIGGDLRLEDLEVSSLSGLERLDTIGGALWLSDNDDLESLQALAALTSVEALRVERNRALPSLRGLEGVTSYAGDVVVILNDELTSLDGLENVTRIDGDLRVTDNERLPACEAYALYEGLSSFGGALLVERNLGTCATGDTGTDP